MSVCLVAIGAALYVTMVTCYHHFFKVEFAIFRAILSFTILQFYAHRCDCKLTSRQAVPTVNSAENAIAAGAQPRTPLGELTTLPGPPSRLGADTPPHTPPHSVPLAPGCSRLRRLDRRALLTQNPGDATGHHHFLRQKLRQCWWHRCVLGVCVWGRGVDTCWVCLSV